MNEAPTGDGAMAVGSTPGRQLVAARNASGLIVADIARQLKLSPRQIEALETDDYASLPGPVFVRGFIRNYARMVKLDPAPMLEYAERQMRPVAQSSPEQAPPVEIPFSNRPHILWRKYAIAAVVLLIPLAYFVIYHDDNGHVVGQPSVIELPPPPIVGEGASGNAPAQGAATDDARSDTLVQAQDTTQGESRSAERPAQARNPGEGARVTEHVVKMRFERESWVEIRDRHGRKIFSQMNHAGSDQAVSGEPPLTLIVGNAAGVRVLHNDQPVDLAPHIKVDVARLTLE